MAKTKNPNSERVLINGCYKSHKDSDVTLAINPYPFTAAKVSNTKPTNYEALRHIKGV
jgi:hypothetical protein